MPPHPSLKPGNVAVVTGAGSGGIGASVARLLTTRYNLRIVLADSHPATLTAAHDNLIKAGVPEENILTRVTDVSDSSEVFALADVAFERFGQVDFLFLNAGTTGPSKDFAPGGDLAAWNKIISVNFGGVLNGTQAFVERIVEQVGFQNYAKRLSRNQD